MVTAVRDRNAAMRETVRRSDAADEVWGHILLVHRALGTPYGPDTDKLTGPQIAEAARQLHAAGADDDTVREAIRALVDGDVYRAGETYRLTDLSDAHYPAQDALLAVAQHRDRDAVGTAMQHERAAALLRLAAEDHPDRDAHVEELVTLALFLTGQVAPVAGHSLALAATLTTGSTYMLLAAAVEQMLTTW